MNDSTRAQWRQIRDYLLLGYHISQAQAYEKFGCFRLSERIREIQSEGWMICKEMIKTTTGKRVMEYWILAK